MMAAEKEQVASLPEGSILDPEIHSRLLADIQGIARQANVPVSMIHKSAKDYCGQKEIEWIKNYQKNLHDGSGGLCFVGKFNKSIDTTMMALTCVFIRNFIDARIITLSQIIQLSTDGEMPDPTVLLIPNFYVDMESGKPLAGYQAASLHSLLVGRLVNARATVLYASSIDTLKKQYGDAMGAFIEEHYQIIEGN